MLFFWRINQPKTRRFIIGLFLDATLYLLKRVRLSVRPSVHPYVRPSIRVCPSVRRPSVHSFVSTKAKPPKLQKSLL